MSYNHTLSFDQQVMASKLENYIKQTVAQALQDETITGSYDIATALRQKIRSRMQSLTYDPAFKSSNPYGGYTISHVGYTDNIVAKNLEGTLIVSHEAKKNTMTYGPPGYPGKYDGQLFKDPDTNNYYKWDSFRNKWLDIYECMSYDENTGRPTTGTNRFNASGGRSINWGSSGNKSGYGIEPRDSNPGDHNPWGLPGITPGSSNGLAISKLKTIFNLAIDFSSFIDHIKAISDATKQYWEKEDEEEIENPRRNQKQEVHFSANRGMLQQIDSTFISDNYPSAKKDSIDLIGSTVTKYGMDFKVYNITITPMKNEN